MSVSEYLRADFPEPKGLCFIGVPVENLGQEDLIKLIYWFNRDVQRLQESADQNRRMHQMFAEARSRL